MSASSVITLGYGQGVNFIPTLGYGNYGSSTPTARDQGAGAGKRKLDFYKAVGEYLAKSKPKPKPKPPKIPEIDTRPSLSELPQVLGLTESQIKLKDVEALAATLEEISLQEQEDETIFMRMMLAI